MMGPVESASSVVSVSVRGEGGGGSSKGEGGGGDKITRVGSSSTLKSVMPSAAVAEAAVPRLEESVLCTAAAVVEAGTAMLAMMSTLAAVMVIETDEASTPALSAIWRLSSSRRWSV